MPKAARFRTILIGLTVLFADISGASAEVSRDLRLGAYVRATVMEPSPKTPHEKRITGTLLDLNDSTIKIGTSRWDSPSSYSTIRATEVELQNVSNLEMRLQPSRKGRGALIGLVVGAATGVLLGLSAGDDPEGWFSFTAEQKAGMAALPLGLLGAVIGAISAPGEKWMPVPPELKATSPGSRLSARSGVGITITF